MNHYLICVSYLGASFQGWQRLKEQRNTIQQILEDCISELLQEPITIRGSGRTDAKVNAISQYADFFCQASVDADCFLMKLNHLLPHDIRVKSIQPVSQNFHSRKSCVSKTYQYCVSLDQKPDVFAQRYLLRMQDLMLADNIMKAHSDMNGTYTLNIDAMKQAISQLIGNHDFSAFTTDKTPGKSHIRTLFTIELSEKTLESGKKILIMSFTGNGFLYNMVRILAGTLLMVGLDQMDSKDISNILKAGKRESSGPTLPAHALFLFDVSYNSFN